MTNHTRHHGAHVKIINNRNRITVNARQALLTNVKGRLRGAITNIRRSAENAILAPATRRHRTRRIRVRHRHLVGHNFVFVMGARVISAFRWVTRATLLVCRPRVHPPTNYPPSHNY